MLTLIVIVHVIVCIALIMIVLLQTGKGADMGAAFGAGSSQTLFGTSGASTVLSKATTGAAIIFMITSLALAYMSGHQSGRSIMKDAKPPVTQPAPEKPQSPETTASGTQESKTAPQPEAQTKSQPAEAPKTEVPKPSESVPAKPQ